MKRILILLSLFFSVFVFAPPMQAAIHQADNVAYAAVSESTEAAIYDVTAVEIAEPENDVKTAFSLDGVFSTFLALVAFIPIVVQFLRKRLIPNATSVWVQVFSWAVGMTITLAGWMLNLGFLDGLSIWLALLYGLGACLAANGVFDTGLIVALFGLFEKKTVKGR